MLAMPGMVHELGGMVPGQYDAVQTTENALNWGSLSIVRTSGMLMGGASRDLGNSPTSVIRKGMLLGMCNLASGTNNYCVAAYAAGTSDSASPVAGLLYPWDPTATDGTQTIFGIAFCDYPMMVAGKDANRWPPVIVGGPVKAEALFRSYSGYGPGLFAADPYEQLARLQMIQGGKFWFDDSDHQAPFGFAAVKALAASYTAVAADNGTLFTNTGAGGAVTLTLPTLTVVPASTDNGIGFHCAVFMTVAQNVTITGSASNIYMLGQSAGSSFTITGAIGQWIDIYGVYDGGGKWLLTVNASGTITVNNSGGNAGTLLARTATTDGTGNGLITAGVTDVVVTNATSVAYAVKLPAFTYVNQRITLIGGAMSTVVRGPTSSTIDGIAAATGVVLPAGTRMDIVCTDITGGAQVFYSERGPVAQTIQAIAGSATVTIVGAMTGATTQIAASSTLVKATGVGTAVTSMGLPTPLYLGQRLTITNTVNYAVTLYTATDGVPLIVGGAARATTYGAVLPAYGSVTLECTSLGTGATDVAWVIIAATSALASAAGS